MNAAKARRKRGGTTLLGRTMHDPARAAHINELIKAADIEQVVQSIMKAQNISAAELARRLDSKPPQISWDIHGGLRKASLARLGVIAEALDCDFVPALVPRNEPVQRARFFEAYKALAPAITTAASDGIVEATRSKKSRSTPRKRKCASSIAKAALD